jgi:fatty-acyl-CoA synthase
MTDSVTMTEANTLVGLLDQLGDSDRRVVFPEPDVAVAHRDLPDLARDFAATLRVAGVRGGDVVGILVPTGPEWLPAFFGVTVCGAVASVLPLPPMLLDVAAAARHLMPLITTGRIRHLVAAGIGTAVAAELAAQDPDLVVIDAAGAHQPAPATADRDFPAPDPDAPAVVQFSSGSTARPKGALLTHRAILAGVTAITRHLRTRPDDVLVQWVPLFHDMGLVALLCALATRADAHQFRASTFIRSPKRVLIHLAKVRGSIVTGPNFSYDRMVEAAATCGLEPTAFRAWRLALNGAETVRPETVAAFRDAFGPLGAAPSTMYPCYGMAEATLAITLPRLGVEPRCVTVDRDTLVTGRAVRIIDDTADGWSGTSVGVPVPGLSLRIVDDSGATLPEGHLGEVCVRGESLFTRYLHDPDTTTAALRDGWLHSGDLGFLHDGDLFLVTRIKEMIVVQGRNFYPDDIENIVSGLPGIYRGRCVAVALAERESIAVVAESSAHTDETERADIVRRIRGDVVAALGLAAIEVLLVAPRSLPRTTSGKWRRSRVREMVAAGPVGS